MNTNTELTPITQTIPMEKSIDLRENSGSSVSISIHTPPTPADHPQPCIAELQLPASVRQRASSPRSRNGKIARLPKLERDMVNRMLFQNIPYPKIVLALKELNIHATQRNISNWKTRGGYNEWRQEQERQLHLSHLQDHLTDYIRKNNATQLPEAGLQVAATQLSLTLLQPDSARQLAADPQKYSQIVNMLCRLSMQIHTLQKDRNKTVKKASRSYTTEFVARKREKDVERVRESCSALPGEGPGGNAPHRNDLPPRDQLPYRETETRTQPSPLTQLLDQLQKQAPGPDVTTQ